MKKRQLLFSLIMVLLAIWQTQCVYAADQMLSSFNTWENGATTTPTWSAPYYTLKTSASSTSLRFRNTAQFPVPASGGYFVVISKKNTSSSYVPSSSSFKLRLGSAKDGTQWVNDATSTASYETTNTTTSDIVYINSWTVGAQTYGNVYPALTFIWPTASLTNYIDLRAALWLDSNTGSIVTSQSSITFSQTGYQRTFYVAGLNLSNANMELSDAITLTAPAGVTLSTTTISANDAATKITAVTATWNKSTVYAADNITLTSGSVTKNISISTGKNIAPDASTVNASYTASWNSLSSINDGIVGYGIAGGGIPALSGDKTWACWQATRTTTTNAQLQTLDYTWATTKLINMANVYFWCDKTTTSGATDNVTLPASWKIQYWDGAAWADVTLLSGQTYTRNIAASNPVEFTPVSTTKLRLYMTPQSNGTTYSAVGVTEFETYASYILPSVTSLAMSGSNPNTTFTVSGFNLVDPITISAPAGITINPTSLDAASRNASVSVTYDGTTTVNGNITLTSGNTTAMVAVTGTAAPVINASNPTSLSFTVSTPAPTFQVTAANLTADLTFTGVPAAITLSGTNVINNGDGTYKISQANANGTNTVTATWNRASNITSTNITIGSTGASSQSLAVSTTDNVEAVAMAGITLSAGVLSPAFAVGTTSYKTKSPADVNSIIVSGTTTPSVGTVINSGTAISALLPSVVLTGNSYNGAAHTSDYTVTWDGNYTLADWDANGSTDATLSIPTVYGWSATPSLTWIAANGGTAGTVRYIDNPSGYTYNGNPWTGRILYVRWDGGATARVYSYPVLLNAGTTYKFSAKAAYNSVVSGGTLSFRVNTVKDNSGTPYGTGGTVSLGSTTGVLTDVSLTGIAVPTTGVYYLTITSDNGALDAIADLALTEDTPTATFNVSQQKQQVIVNAGTLCVKNASEYTVYNAQGVKVAEVAHNDGFKTISLLPGIYIVKSADFVKKVVVE